MAAFLSGNAKQNGGQKHRDEHTPKWRPEKVALRPGQEDTFEHQDWSASCDSQPMNDPQEDMKSVQLDYWKKYEAYSSEGGR